MSQFDRKAPPLSRLKGFFAFHVIRKGILRMAQRPAHTREPVTNLLIDITALWDINQ
jgi:hypothetical protein